jgi:hypothetical protein
MTDVLDRLDQLDLTDLTDRYVAVWNEPDPDRRRRRIAELWAPGGGQILVDPPEEVRAVADHHRFRHPFLAVHGHEALDARVTRAHEMFVAPGEHVFAAAAETVRPLRHVVVLTWAMVSTADGTPAGGGINVLQLDDAGRILTDHLYVER